MSKQSTSMKRFRIFLNDERIWVSYRSKRLIERSRDSIVFEAKLGGSAIIRDILLSPQRKAVISNIAIKVCHSEFMSANTGDFKVLPLLNHPRIPKLIGCSYDPLKKQAIYGLTLGTGGDMMTWIESKLPTEEILAPIVYKILEVVHYAHQQGIVHRDIKLENIIFTNEAQDDILLVDWGFATEYSTSECLSIDCGSFHYSCPEIVARESYFGPDVDVWSLGVLLYSALTGYFPFAGETSRDKLKCFQTPVSFPPHVSSEFCSLIQSFLQVEPKNRLPLSEALTHPWFIRYSPVSLPPQLPFSSPLVSPPQRNSLETSVQSSSSVDCISFSKLSLSDALPQPSVKSSR